MADNPGPELLYRVRLRPATVVDAEFLELFQSPEYRGEFNDFGQIEGPSDREDVEPDVVSGVHSKRLIVERIDNRVPIGTVSWHGVRYGPNVESLAWNIGIALVPEARGHGYGPEAQRLLADHLFATTAANRVEAAADVTNHAELRALTKAGFEKEGVLRGAQYRAGTWHDLALYSSTRSNKPDPA